jgi:hypothetical protein
VALTAEPIVEHMLWLHERQRWVHDIRYTALQAWHCQTQGYGVIGGGDFLLQDVAEVNGDDTGVLVVPIVGARESV